MKYLTCFLVAIFFSIGAEANNVNERVACESLAVQALMDHDWKKYEDESAESKVLQSNLVKNQLLYTVRVGNEVATDGPTNSAYQVVVDFTNNEREGIGASLKCTVVDIREKKKRK